MALRKLRIANGRRENATNGTGRASTSRRRRAFGPDIALILWGSSNVIKRMLDEVHSLGERSACVSDVASVGLQLKLTEWHDRALPCPLTTR